MDKWDYMVLVESQNVFRLIEDYEVPEVPPSELSEKEMILLECKEKPMSQVLVLMGGKGWELVCISNSTTENNRRQFFFKKKM